MPGECRGGRDAALDGDVQGGSEFVGDQQLGVAAMPMAMRSALAHPPERSCGYCLARRSASGGPASSGALGDAFADLALGDVVCEQGLLDLVAAELGFQVLMGSWGRGRCRIAQLHPLVLRLVMSWRRTQWCRPRLAGAGQ